MGLDTLVNGKPPKQPQPSRRGDIALVLGMLLGAMEAYRTFIPPAQAGQSDERIEKLIEKVQAIDVRLSVLESKRK
jgi:hypothetical protein